MINHHTGIDWDQEILSMQPGITDRPPPPRGMFLAYFSNRKKRGFKPVQHCECEGVLYSSGHVHLDTHEVPCHDFGSMGQMRDYLETFGDVAICWLDQEKEGVNG